MATINWKNVPKKELKVLELAIKWGVVDMSKIKELWNKLWEGIKKGAVKLFKGMKKVLTSDMAKIQMKRLWDKYANDFEGFWNAYKDYINKR